MTPRPEPSSGITSGVPLHAGTENASVLAAGALLWRVRQGALQVLLIHRPKYDDWSFPKGKLDPGETLAECAVREVSEEIGVDIRLGRALPSVSYIVPKGPKTVAYWAAHAPSAEPVPDGFEVDEVLWADMDLARRTLSKELDQAPLAHLEALHRQGTLETVPFLIARHGKATPRSQWSKADGGRPLAPSGVRQSQSLAKLLACWGPTKIASSPWKRCMQTIQPYANAVGPRLKLKEVEAFTEDFSRIDPKKTARKFGKLFSSARTTVVCGHRPVMPIFFEVLRSHAATDQTAAQVPARDPYLKPGAVLVGHMPAKRLGVFVDFEVHEPYFD